MQLLWCDKKYKATVLSMCSRHVELQLPLRVNKPTVSNKMLILDILGKPQKKRKTRPCLWCCSKLLHSPPQHRHCLVNSSIGVLNAQTMGSVPWLPSLCNFVSNLSLSKCEWATSHRKYLQLFVRKLNSQQFLTNISQVSMLDIMIILDASEFLKRWHSWVQEITVVWSDHKKGVTSVPMMSNLLIQGYSRVRIPNGSKRQKTEWKVDQGLVELPTWKS